MSLRILFADDSMTAQNMGKKILSEAGYDVVAVSNGAAAVKKIAEQKPDIIILDVYMPGYTGLEVCEKVRGSIDTLKTPVLLTVGKLEPYKPEDANRVKADGVIIKPFEASDLLAIVKKFEERIGNAPPPPLAKPAPVEHSYEEEEPVTAAGTTSAPASSRPSGQPLVEVPDHMATSAAFGDLLGSEPASTSHFAVNTPSAAFETSVIVPAPPVPVTDYASPAVTSEEVPVVTEETSAATAVSEEQNPEPIADAPVRLAPDAVTPEIDAAPEVTVTHVEAAPEPAEVPEPPHVAVSQPRAEASAQVAAEPATEAQHPQFIPVFKEPEPAQEYAFMPTSVSPVEDVEIVREPALQETAEETTRSTRADRVEPGLLSTIGQQVHSFDEPVENSIPPVPQPKAEPASFEVSGSSAPAADTMSDADFEARVAAAMSAYNASEAPTATVPPVELHAAEHTGSLASADVHEMHEVEVSQAAHEAVAEIPAFEYQPPVRSEAPAAEAAHVAAEAAAPESSASSVAEAAATPEAAVAAAADTNADHHTIAQAIHRVMERLKPELVEEIMRELRPKK